MIGIADVSPRLLAYDSLWHWNPRSASRSYKSWSSNPSTASLLSYKSMVFNDPRRHRFWMQSKVCHSITPMTDPPNLWAGLHDSKELWNYLLYSLKCRVDPDYCIMLYHYPNRWQNNMENPWYSQTRTVAEIARAFPHDERKQGKRGTKILCRKGNLASLSIVAVCVQVITFFQRHLLILLRFLQNTCSICYSATHEIG